MGSAIEEIKAQIATKESELQRVGEELEVLRGALAIMRGHRLDDNAEGQARLSHNIPDLVREAISKADGCQLSADNLVSALKAKGCQATRQTILGGAYRMAKAGDGIVLLRRGVFGMPTEGAEEGFENLEDAV